MKLSGRLTQGCAKALLASIACAAPLHYAHAQFLPTAQAVAEDNIGFGDCNQLPIPPQAFEKNESGIVTLEILVQANGQVMDAKILSSSKSALLDQRAMQRVRACRFLPFRDLDGKAQPSRMIKRYEWSPDEFVRHTASKPPAPDVPVSGPAALMLQTRTCAKPVWPTASLRAEETGTVTMRFLVNTEGKVTKSEILNSSGFPLLDNAALDGLSLCRFAYTDKSPIAAATWVKMQYVWTLE
ncbi:energy transducer TonB [Massilia sp. CF038]|uniref:energy transducer TonB n=1 Tax=Massilia sp. CF038 TaxID=1881045 RepID=UPI00091ACD36|nr:energy transducer TonB [Massilia sp. CF038]SHG77305.1 TonB family C-terminal domain-containing protein [Massilia sp. CF038]